MKSAFYHFSIRARRLPVLGPVFCCGWAAARWGWHRFGTPFAIGHYLRTHEVRKLHIGASDANLSGWLNADLLPTRFGVVRMDATEALPVPDGSFHFVFSEHMIEHISVNHARRMLAQCHRTLAPGGWLRIATPDLVQVLRLRLDPNAIDVQRYLAWAGERLSLTDDASRPARIVNSLFHDHCHQFLYDEETLTCELSAAGFSDVRRCRCGESGIPELRNLERHQRVIGEEFNAYETLVVEARKP